jgi:arginase
MPDFRETAIADADEKLRRMGHIYALLSEKVKDVVQHGLVPVSISGDCVSTLGVLGGLQKAGEEPERILWLDAHGDFHTWATTQTQYIGGMPLAMLVGRGERLAPFAGAIGVKPYPEGQIVLSDGRDLDPGEREALQSSHVVRCTITDIFQHLTPHERLYLHWDTDVVDAQRDMPALKYHVQGGPSIADMRVLFQQLRHTNLVAVSVSAWHEEQDQDNTTAMACLQLLKELGIQASVP